jgi:hypothetical protein
MSKHVADNVLTKRDVTAREFYVQLVFAAFQLLTSCVFWFEVLLEDVMDFFGFFQYK